MTEWLSDERPHEPRVSAAQIAEIRRLLGAAPRAVLDLGCGSGRVLVPLAADGHRMTGLDRDRAALDRCRRRAAAAALREADFLAPLPFDDGAFDAVLCLGNTIMTVVDVDRAVDLLVECRRVLAGDGLVMLDDCPGAFWPEVAEGNWQSGVAEDGSATLAWEPTDAVLTMDAGRGPRRLRMWTDGALRLAARAAGLSGPRRVKHACLLVLRRDAREAAAVSPGRP